MSKNLPLRDRLPRYGGGGACARGGAVPRRGGGREPCHSPKYFGQPYSSLPHRLRAEPPRRGGQGVSTPFSTVWPPLSKGGGRRRRTEGFRRAVPCALSHPQTGRNPSASQARHLPLTREAFRCGAVPRGVPGVCGAIARMVQDGANGHGGQRAGRPTFPFFGRM